MDKIEQIEDISLDKLLVANKHLYFGIWDESQHMKRKVRDSLMGVAKEFKSFCKFRDFNISEEDIMVTGSMANYNFNRQSDLDLHLLLDYDKCDYDKELLEEYFKTKRNEWKHTKKVKIFGHDVECYVQDIKEPHNSSGVYSILDNKWIRRPKYEKFFVPRDDVKRLTKIYIDKITDLEKEVLKRKIQLDYDCGKKAEELMLELKDKRQRGLETKYKEYAIYNLVFKILRNMGYMDRLTNLKNRCITKKLTIKTR